LKRLNLTSWKPKRGASLFGAIGVILAVPMAAFLRSLWINRIRGKI